VIGDGGKCPVSHRAAVPAAFRSPEPAVDARMRAERCRFKSRSQFHRPRTRLNARHVADDTGRRGGSGVFDTVGQKVRPQIHGHNSVKNLNGITFFTNLVNLQLIGY